MGREEVREGMGVEDQQRQSIIYRVEEQRGPTVHAHSLNRVRLCNQ